MTTLIVNWSLDTCPCFISSSYDDTTPLDTRTYTVVSINPCQFHAGLGNDQTIRDIALEENQRKNNAIQNILDNVPTSLQDKLYTLMQDGITRIIKKGVSITFTLTGTAPNRVLNLTITGATLTNAQKNNAQTFLDNRFGTGKVVIA